MARDNQSTMPIGASRVPAKRSTDEHDPGEATGGGVYRLRHAGRGVGESAGMGASGLNESDRLDAVGVRGAPPPLGRRTPPRRCRSALGCRAASSSRRRVHEAGVGAGEAQAAQASQLRFRRPPRRSRGARGSVSTAARSTTPRVWASPTPGPRDPCSSWARRVRARPPRS